MGRFPSVGTRVNWGLDARIKAQIKIVANEKTMEDFHVERETLRQQVKGLEANLRKKDDLLSSQDDTRCFNELLCFPSIPCKCRFSTFRKMSLVGVSTVFRSGIVFDDLLLEDAPCGCLT